MAAPGQLLTLNTPFLTSRRRISTTAIAKNTSTSLVSTAVKCTLSSHQNPKPSNSPFQRPFFSITKSIGASGAAAILFHLSSNAPSFIGGGNGVNGGGGGGGGGNDGFWSRIFSPAAIAKDEESKSQEWDSHGLPANIVVQLNKLSGFKKYKVSDIIFFDRREEAAVGAGDSFFEMVSLRPGYTKVQLHKELETLVTCGMFEKIDLEAKTNPDGTIGVAIPFTESTWQSAERFRCINVGLMPQTKQTEMDPDMTDKEKIEFVRTQEKDYRRRIERSRPCLLRESVNREVLQMLREQGKVSARLLQKIRDRVQQWYHDEGYACAQVVNFGNLNTKEVVCEVVEGDITQMAIQFQDKLGNIC